MFERSAEPPALHEADGRVARAGRADRLHGQPDEKILPYVRQPEDVVPGEPLFFATAMAPRGEASGLLVESHMGRPTKIEGNPDHPASLGGTASRAGRRCWGCTIPTASKTSTRIDSDPHLGGVSATVRGRARRGSRGKGRPAVPDRDRHLADAGRADARVLAKYPEAKWHQWEPLGGIRPARAPRIAFGEPADTRYQLGKRRCDPRA